MAEKEYINKLPIIRDLTAMKSEYDAISLDGIIKALMEAPAADVDEVVRCKDCTAWVRNTGIADSPNGHCFEHGICTNGHDFCSYGERKEATP